MTQDEINKLTQKEMHLIISPLTKHPYIDEQDNCYMFELMREASDYVKEKPGTAYDKAQFYRQIICSDLYAIGAKRIIIKQANVSKPIEIEIDKSSVKKQFYNVDTSRLVYQIKQTKKKKYLLKLIDRIFYMPVLIDVRVKKHYPHLHYSYATFNGDDLNYLLFTTLQEFDKWNESQNGKWKALETTLIKFESIRNGKAIFINPLHEQLILTDKQLKMILKEKNNA